MSLLCRPTIGRELVKNTSDDIINDVINAKNYRNVTHVGQKIFNKFYYCRTTIGKSSFDSASAFNMFFQSVFKTQTSLSTFTFTNVYNVPLFNVP